MFFLLANEGIQHCKSQLTAGDSWTDSNAENAIKRLWKVIRDHRKLPRNARLAAMSQQELRDMFNAFPHSPRDKRFLLTRQQVRDCCRQWLNHVDLQSPEVDVCPQKPQVSATCRVLPPLMYMVELCGGPRRSRVSRLTRKTRSLMRQPFFGTTAEQVVDL